MKYILLFILFICSSNIIKAQDTLSMRSGENILVKVIEVSNVRLKLKNTFKGYIEVGTAEVKYKKLDNLNGPVFSMLKSDLLMIKYQNGTSDDFSKEAQKIKKQKIWIRLGGPLLAAGLLIGLGKFLSAVASAGSW